MSTAPRVRTATPADNAVIAAIFNQYLGRATMVLRPRTTVDYQFLNADHRSAGLMAVDSDDSPFGFAYVKPYSERGGYVLAGEVTIFLDEQRTGSGTGSLLYDALLPLAHQLGYRHLTAKIFANNVGSIRFHERYGFRLVGTQRGIGLIDGRRVDTVIMERSVPS